jgi:antitoxin ParD1/3/4
MDTTDIRLSPDSSQYVQEQIASGRFESPSDVVNEAIRQARVREAKQKLAELLQEGLDSGPPIEVNEAWWQSRRAEILAKHRPECAE